MKELSIEEKAKAYDKVLEWATEAHKVCDGMLKEDLEHLFPELKESEDEEIKKAIIKHFENLRIGENLEKFYGVDIDTILAWLEKQGGKESVTCPICGWELKNKGEQKPTDKVEPKFKNGQWIVWQDKCYKVNYNGCGYELVDQNGFSTSLEYGTIDENAHLWDITKDAKDGDVLCTYECCEPKIVFILKGTPKKHYALSYYCYYNIMYPHFASDSEKGCLAPNDEDVKPATKEQRETLFKAMHEAGYEWDAEKKELKKIEENPAWSEEDERTYKSVLYAFEHNYPLNSEQQKFVKYLKNRYTWKPSDEQMITLRRVISGCSYDIEPLVEIEEQLKKLRGE